jgi:Na+-driven multidrug efflux pump
MTAVMPVTLKVYNLIGEITIGIAAGMLAAGSWAFSSARYHRLLQVTCWAALIALVQQVIMTPIMIIKPSVIMKIWLSTDSSIRVCDKYMPILFYANMLLALHETGTDLLLATNRPWLAMVPMATRGVLFALGAWVYWLGGKDDPANVLFVFPSIDIAMFMSICCLLPATLKRLWVSKDVASD